MKTLLAAILLFSTFSMAAVTKEPFGKTSDGRQVYLYTMKNNSGMEVAITNFGATIVSLKVPDRQGKFADVVLGFDNVSGYESKADPYFGATIGRYANRIAKGRFTLDGRQYQLAINNPPNSLHGGAIGFDKRVWTVEEGDSNSQHLSLHYLSPDGEENYPGNLSVSVTFTLTDANELKIEYAATTDRDTVINLTNHSYFNLYGQGEGDILSHVLTLFADKFTPVDLTLIPTGELRSVGTPTRIPAKSPDAAAHAITPFDFRRPAAIGARVNDYDEQLKFGRGYDHNWVVNGNMGELRQAARVVEPRSGRQMDVLTTEPGIQFYCGNFLDGTVKGKGGKVYKHRYGFSLETQHFPDSPNHPSFPTTELKARRQFRSTTVYRFSVAKGH